MSDKREAIKKINDSINDSQNRAFVNADQLLVVNIECETKLTQLVGSQDGVFTINIAEAITHEILHKCSMKLLTAFIKARPLNNLTKIYNIPAKKEHQQKY